MDTLTELSSALVEDPVVSEGDHQSTEEDIFVSVRSSTVFVALEEAVKEQGCDATPTTLFAAIMTALEAGAPRTAELLELLIMALPEVSMSVLRRKFDVAATILAKVLAETETTSKKKRKIEDDMSGACARRAVQALGALLGAQESSDAAWKAPGKLRALETVFVTATDKRPKVRKAARYALATALKHQPPLKYCPGRIDKAFAGKQNPMLKAEPPPGAFHMLALAEDVGKLGTTPGDRLLQAVAKSLQQRGALRRKSSSDEDSLDPRALRFDVAALSTLAGLVPFGTEGTARKAREVLVGLGSPPLEAFTLAWTKAVVATVTKAPDIGIEASTLAEMAVRNARDDRSRIRSSAADLVGACCHHAPEKFRDAAVQVIEVLWTANVAVSDVANWFTARKDLLAVLRHLATKRDSLLVDKTAQNDDFFVHAASKLGMAAFSRAAPPLVLHHEDKMDLPKTANRIDWLAPLIRRCPVDGDLRTFLDLWLPAATGALAGHRFTTVEAGWSVAPKFCFGGDSTDLDRLATALVGLLTTNEGANTTKKRLRRLACDACVAVCFAQHKKKNGGLFAKRVTPSLLALATSSDDEEDSSDGPLAALEAVAGIIDSEYAAALFKKVAKRLVASLAAVVTGAKPKKRRREDDAMEEDVSEEKRAASLCGIAGALVPAFDSAQCDVLWRAAKPVLEDARAPIAVQKRAYAVVQSLCNAKWLDDNLTTVSTCLAAGSVLACHVSCRGPRLRCMEGVVLCAAEKKIDDVTELIAKIAGEAVISLKDANAKARKAAFSLLDAMATTIENHHGDVGPFLNMIVGALGARTAHMRSAAMAALARVVFERRTQTAVLKQLPDLLRAACLVLRDKAREVAKATLTFVAVALSALLASNRDVVSSFLAQIVDALLVWAKEKKGRFRLKVKMILTKLCRALGFEPILALVPKDDVALVSHIRKIELKNKKKKAAARDAADSVSEPMVPRKKITTQPKVEDDDDDEDRYFDDFEEDDDDDDDDDEVMEFDDNDDDAPSKPKKKQRRAPEDAEVLDLLAQRLGGGGDNDDEDDDDFDGLQFDEKTGRITVPDDDDENDDVVLPKKQPPKQNGHAKKKQRPRKLRGKEAAAAKRRKKTGGDVLKPGQLQPYSWSTLADITRKKRRLR